MLAGVIRPHGLKSTYLAFRPASTYLLAIAVISLFLWITALFSKTQDSGVTPLSDIASAATSTPAREGHWIATWTAAQHGRPVEEVLPIDFRSNGVALQDATIRQTVRISLGADELRIRFSNAFANSDLRIDKATIARPALEQLGVRMTLAGSPGIETATLQRLTFSGRAHAIIPPGGQILSDPVKFPVASGETVSISMYLRDGQKSDDITCHMVSRTNAWLIKGDHTATPTLDRLSSERPLSWYFLSAVEAWKSSDHHAVVVLGDSLTDGLCEFNTNERWTKMLFDRLQNSTHAGVRRLSVVNQAIVGNQLLRTGVAPSLNARLDRDALAVRGIKFAVIVEGSNDVGSGRGTALEQSDHIFNAFIQLEQVVARFHAANIPVFGGTLSPFSCTNASKPIMPNEPLKEEQRLKLNWWIRNEEVYDALIDFDAVLRNPMNGTEMAPEFMSVDCLHPSVAGQRAMADAFPLDIFERFKDGVVGYS